MQVPGFVIRRALSCTLQRGLSNLRDAEMSEGQPAQAASSAPREPSHLESMAAGGFGGLLLVLVGHPLDTIKVRVQSMEVVPGKPPPYSGVIDCARKMIRQEGRWSLYKGIAAPLLGMTPCYALAFLGYSVGKDIFCDDDAFTTLKWNQIGLAGAVSTFFVRLGHVCCIQPGVAPSLSPWASGHLASAACCPKSGTLIVQHSHRLPHRGRALLAARRQRPFLAPATSSSANSRSRARGRACRGSRNTATSVTWLDTSGAPKACGG